jgi:hypothetical protein
VVVVVVNGTLEPELSVIMVVLVVVVLWVMLLVTLELVEHPIRVEPVELLATVMLVELVIEAQAQASEVVVVVVPVV